MRFLLPLCILVVLSSCLSQPDCQVVATNNLRISFKSKSTGKDSIVKFTSVSVVGTEIMLYKDTATTAPVVPLNPHDVHTTIRFHYGSKIDTMAVNYTVKNAIISPECGAYVYYVNLTVPASSFANLKIVSNQLSTSVPVNIEIKL